MTLGTMFLLLKPTIRINHFKNNFLLQVLKVGRLRYELRQLIPRFRQINFSFQML